MDLVSFDNIAGVPIFYARHPVAPYGTKGKGPRVVRLERNFKDQLEACLNELWDLCPMGRPTELVSGGCYVEKAGRHGEGRAVDIDALWWDDLSLITKEAPLKPIMYLGIEAVLRKHIGTVLNYWYNQAHEDHWHCDNGTPVGHRPGSRAQGLFIQASLKFVHGHIVDIDGVVGKETKKALSNVMNDDDIRLTGDFSKFWMSFLDLTASTAFSKL